MLCNPSIELQGLGIREPRIGIGTPQDPLDVYALSLWLGTSYTATAFSLTDQERLCDFVKALHKRGCYVMLSNSENDAIESLYKDFNVHRVLATRAINCKGNRRGRINELLITNY